MEDVNTIPNMPPYNGVLQGFSLLCIELVSYNTVTRVWNAGRNCKARQRSEIVYFRGQRKFHNGNYSLTYAVIFEKLRKHPCSSLTNNILTFSVKTLLYANRRKIMIAMPKELQQAVRASQGKPVRLADPETNAEYVVLSAEVYKQMERLFYDDNPMTKNAQQNVLIKAGLRAGWDDPEMDIYNDLDPRSTS